MGGLPGLFKEIMLSAGVKKKLSFSSLTTGKNRERLEIYHLHFVYIQAS